MKARDAFDLAVSSGQPLPTAKALSEQMLDKRTREGVKRFSDRIDRQVLRGVPRPLGGMDALESARKQMLKGTSLDSARKQMLKQVSSQLGGQAQKALREQQQRSGGLSSILEGMRSLSDFAPQIERQRFEMDDSLRRIGDAHAREKREAIEREMAMVNYLASLSRSFQRAEAHEAAALERADQAEKREQAAIARSERIQRRSFWIAVAALVFTVISTTAAVLALFVA